MAARVLPNDLKYTISGGEYLLVALWALGLVLLYVMGGSYGVRLLQKYKAQTAQFRQDWISAQVVGPAVETANLPSPNEEGPVDVNVGIYIDYIGEFSLTENRWTADFDLWFAWTGDQVHPGETFEIVDGQVEHKEKIESRSQGDQHYERYRIRARILKFIDPSRFPFNDEEAGICIEEKINSAGRLRYVADAQKSDINPQAIRRFLRITKSAVFVKNHARGVDRNMHSRFIYAMLISPLGMDIYVKMFQGLFASVAIALLAPFIRPTHSSPKISLGIGAFFAVIGNNIALGITLLGSNKLSLADMVTGIGLATIFLVLAESAVSLYVFDSKGREKLSRLLDKTTFVVLLLGYVAINVLLPLAAKS